jgi:hypothetical protein
VDLEAPILALGRKKENVMRSAVHLSIVKDPPSAAADAAPGTGDIVLLGALFVLNLIPVAGELAGVGHWSAAIVGFATAAALLTGRELWSELRACARARC